MTDTDITKSVESALSAFNEYKGMVTGFEKKLKDITPKLDALDTAKFDRMAADIARAIEVSQAAEQKAKALEEKNVLLEAAMNRPGAGGSTEERKERNHKLFDSFMRNAKSREIDFADYVKELPNVEMEVKTLSTYSDPDGGYLVTPEFGGIVNTFVYESSPIRSLATVTQIGGTALEMVVDNGQTTSGWVGENEARPVTGTPLLNKLTIIAKELYAQPDATQQMLDDGMVNVEAWLAGKVGEEFARKEATAFVNGNGLTQPRGLLTYASGTDVAQQQVERVVSGSGTTFTYDGLIDLTGALKEPYQANAVFLCRRTSLNNLLKLKDGQSQPIFNLSYSSTAGVQRTILGQPLYFAADIPAVASNALAMVYGDIRRAYQIVDRVGLRVLRDAYTNKPYVRFYTTKRVGGEVVNYEALKIQTIST